MQVTIEDHATQVGPNRGKLPFRWWVDYSADGVHAAEPMKINFSDFAAYLVARGEFDGYDDQIENGCLFIYEYRDDYEIPWCGKVTNYTYDQVIREFLLTRDLEPALAEFVAVKLAEANVIEDFLLRTEEAA